MGKIEAKLKPKVDVREHPAIYGKNLRKTVFSNKIYGKRSAENRKKKKELDALAKEAAKV